MNTSSYGTILLASAIVFIVGGLVAMYLISKVTPRGTVLFVAIGVFALSWMFQGATTRELLVLSGATRLLGFVGIALGIVDLVRKRKGEDRGAM